MAVSPFTISVKDEVLSDLKARLEATKFPDQLDGPDQWNFGTPLSDVQRLIRYWRDKFDWRGVESNLNKLPHFITPIEVDGFGVLDIHFIHQRSENKHAVPLLFSHGWPGSFIEVTKLLPLLGGGEGGRPAFHVVAPSLPNFGFSSGVSKKGFGLRQYAEVFNKLMLKLGYQQYLTQGGDWGFAVTRSIGKLYPQHCKASHINLILANAPEWTSQPALALKHALTPYTKRERKAIEQTEWFNQMSYGYNILQSTKPQTVGFGLADSPAMLLAWIYEKLRDWTDSYPWTDDEILTWVSIYWFSRAGPEASVRIYYEAQHPDNIEYALSLRKWIPHVKLGVSHFPKEIWCVPDTWAETLGPVVFQGKHERGGHFAAWEQPEALVNDLNKMFGKAGKCYGVIEGLDGYGS